MIMPDTGSSDGIQPISNEPSDEHGNANQQTMIIARIRRLGVGSLATRASSRVPLNLKRAGSREPPRPRREKARAERPRLERIRGPEKSRATNGVWQRVISPRLRARRNNRFLFPSFAARDLPCSAPSSSLLDAAARMYTVSPIPRSYPVPVAQSYGFASGTLLSRHRRRRTKQATAEKVVRRIECRETGSWKFSHAHVSARGARGDSNDDRVEIRPVRVSL